MVLDCCNRFPSIFVDTLIFFYVVSLHKIYAQSLRIIWNQQPVAVQRKLRTSSNFLLCLNCYQVEARLRTVPGSRHQKLLWFEALNQWLPGFTLQLSKWRHRHSLALHQPCQRTNCEPLPRWAGNGAGSGSATQSICRVLVQWWLLEGQWWLNIRLMKVIQIIGQILVNHRVTIVCHSQWWLIVGKMIMLVVNTG